MTKAFEIGDHNVDVQAMREGWEKSKVYSVVPEEVSLSLQMLIRAAQRANSREETSAG